MKDILITPIKQTINEDLIKEYENDIEHACDIKLNVSFISHNASKPNGLCDEAWNSIYPFVNKLANGEYNLYDGWMKDPKTAMISCNDGFRPVSFLLKVLEKKDIHNDNVKLVKLSYEYKDLFFDMMEEWLRIDGVTSPKAIFKNDYRDFDNYLNNLEVTFPHDGLIPDSMFFLLDTNINKFIGACNIRHYLNEGLLLYGGHIGDGIRPLCRNKGYAQVMVKLALEECKKLNIDKILMTCLDTNIGSAKTIIYNGGIYENSVLEEDEGILDRYWIDLK